MSNSASAVTTWHVERLPASPRRSAFRSLTAQGTFNTVGVQMSNVSVVLPFICATCGSSWAASLLFPVFSAGVVVGNAVAPLILQWSRHRRHLVVAGAATAMAVLAACNAVVASAGMLVAAVFMVTSMLIGLISGISSVAFPDLVSGKLPDARRGDVFLTQGAVGSVIATVISLLVVPYVSGGDTVSRHVNLLWFGAVGLAVAGIAAVFIGPLPLRPNSGKAVRPPMREIYRDGLVAARTQPWFRRYAVTQLVFVPVTLGTTFFSLRAAQQHVSGGLPILVMFSSIGLVIGSVVWRIVYRRFGVRGMLLGSAALSSSSALVCIWAEAFGQWSQVWACGTVFLLATIAGQAVFTAAISWISVAAAESHRATMIGFSSALVAVESAIVGAVLGGIAQQHGTSWPVVTLLALNLIAVGVAMGSPTRAQVSAVQDEREHVDSSARAESDRELLAA